MPQELVGEAASLYLQLTVIAVDWGQIGLDEWYERLAFLAKHGDQQFRDLGHYLDLRYMEDDEGDDHRESWSVETALDRENLPPDSEAEGLHGIHIPPPDPIICRFLSSSIPNAKRATHRVWRFHEADRDYFPSVPHGHSVENRDKLDVYLGSVFRGKLLIGWEPRRLLVALWNDSKFRDYARRVIIWYQSENPKFAWRVPNPRKLPRRKPFRTP